MNHGEVPRAQLRAHPGRSARSREERREARTPSSALLPPLFRAVSGYRRVRFCRVLARGDGQVPLLEVRVPALEIVYSS
jgi:hypothetical protein